MAPLIARLCNTVNGHRVTSSGKNLLVEFTSNARNQRQGFAASYAFIPDIDERQLQQQQRREYNPVGGHLPVRDEHDDRPSSPVAGGDIVGAPLGPPVTPGNRAGFDERGRSDVAEMTRIDESPNTPGRRRTSFFYKNTNLKCNVIDIKLIRRLDANRTGG